MRWLMVMLVACASRPVVTLPDGAVDGETGTPVDAVCVPTVQTGCCAAMPNEDEVRACAAAEAPPGICGVVVCGSTDCTAAKIHFCS